jgi:hypothetical protein
MVEILPYQDGDSLPGDDHGSTEILESSGTAETATNRVFGHAQEVLWYEVAHLSVLQLRLMSTRMMRPPLLFPPMHSKLQTRQKSRRLRGRRRTSRAQVVACGLHVDGRLRLITKPGWSNMITNVWPRKSKKTDIVRMKGST